MTKPHDDLLFARYQGFYEYLMDGPDSGRTHPTNDAWNEAYDTGRNEAEALNGPEGNNPFSIPEIDAWMDEATYMCVSSMISDAATLARDGHAGDLNDNPEYTRGLAEFICRSGNLGNKHLDSVIEAIKVTAHSPVASNKTHPIAAKPTDAECLRLMELIEVAGSLVGGRYIDNQLEDLPDDGYVNGAGPDYSREFRASPEYIRALAELICMNVPHVAWIPDSITERIEESALGQS